MSDNTKKIVTYVCYVLIAVCIGCLTVVGVSAETVSSYVPVVLACVSVISALVNFIFGYRS